MARVIVIGAAGLLGGEVVRALRTAGADVVPTGRRPQAGWLMFDAVRDAPEILFRDRDADLVVNCAAVLATEIDAGDPTSVRRAELVNARFPHALAAAAEAAGARLTHVSTDAVFRNDAGRCFEDDDRFSDDLYGSTKLRGEPTAANALTLRCSFVGRDPVRRRGLLEWLLVQPAESEVPGFVDHAWNGLASLQVAAICAALIDTALFTQAREEGAVHHVFEDPPISKYELLVLCARAFGAGVSVVPRESGCPVTRVLGTRRRTLAECLEWLPSRAQALELIARRDTDENG